MLIKVNGERVLSYIIPRYELRSAEPKRRQIVVGHSVSQRCLLCLAPVSSGGRFVVCPKCFSVYHFSCLDEFLRSNNLDVEEAMCIRCQSKFAYLSLVYEILDSMEGGESES